ncbi:MAG: DUF5687 family protein [Bacteroidales bacterium]
MIFKLLRLSFKEKRRSPMRQQNIILNIFLGIILVYFLLLLILFGHFTPRIIEESMDIGESSIPEILGSWLVYYLMFDLFLRFFAQEIPELSARRYLLLPVKRNSLAHFLMLRSLFSGFNLIPTFFFISLGISLGPYFIEGSRLAWFMMIISLVITNHLLNFIIKRKIAEDTWIVIIGALVILLMGIANYFGYFPLTQLSGLIFNPIIQFPGLAFLWMSVPVLVYFLNHRALVKRMYLESIEPKAIHYETRINYAALQRFGAPGELLALELKLILRHKRTRSVLIMVPFLLLYGFLFYTNPVYADKTAWLLFAGIFVTGAFLISYGQFLVAWESSYFDAILTKSINFDEYFKAKYYILVVPTLAAWLITLPYGYFGLKVIFINTAAFLFNVGVNVYVMMLFAAFNQKRLDLSGGSVMNYQGVSAKHWLLSLPLLLFPVIIYLIFNLIWNETAGLVAVGLTGATGVILQNPLLKKLTRFFVSRKYEIASSFRIK